MGGMMSLYRAIAALVFPVAVVLFILGWVALAATVMDSMDVHDARDKFCDMQNVTCEGAQYIATCVFDAFVCFLLLVCAVLLFAFQLTSHSTSSSSSNRSRPVAVDEDGVPVSKATKKHDDFDMVMAEAFPGETEDVVV